MHWTATPFGWSTIVGDVRWTIRRAPSFRVANGRIVRRFWLYRASPINTAATRYSPTGHFGDSVGFTSAREAKAYVAELSMPMDSSK